MRLVLQIPGARSLKDRRQVVRSFKDRVKARFACSIAEVGELGLHQIATLGVAVVSNDHSQCEQLLATVSSLAARLPDAVLADYSTEITTYTALGSNLAERLSSELDPQDPKGST